MGRCERCWLKCSGWIMRDTDTPEDAQIKRDGTPIIIVLQLVVLYFIVSNLTGRMSLVYLSATVFWTTAFCIFLVRGRLGMSMGPTLDVCLPLAAIGCLLNDLEAAAMGSSRKWSFVVIVLDAFLVFNVPRMSGPVIAVTLFYLFIERVEAGSRFGLYNAVSTGTYEICDCSDPPCAQGIFGTLVSGFTVVWIVLLVDFSLTRGFATNLRCQLRRVKAAVEVAAEVTAALARYDVDTAEEAITKGKDLPDELAVSFEELLRNLRSYKAYLPHSCLVAQEESPGQENSSRCPSPYQDGVGGLLLMESVSSDGRDSSMCASDLSKTSERRTSSHVSLQSTLQKAAPRRLRVSLAAGNVVGYLSSQGDLAGASNSGWIEADVERWCAVVSQSRGVVDLIGGDRRYASFNARQVCGGHASAAIGVLSSRGNGNWSGCVVSGQAVCGDFGSASVLRFMVLGGVASSLHPF
eukprot:Hpha_TRINITY_DN15974_c9_g1::TRINITY_DN15974_c9_g1_i1::g.71206::m.71206